ncbi:dihydrolipoyl dehydrogenase [Myxococcota bacterium]|nr:dihydrolipoyl dehydrogenase [Myxococcota bacterium]
MSKFDLIVIGAGPGGYVSAISAAHLGLSVAIIEKDKQLGGTCLLRGCIPTKALLHSADILDEIKNAKSAGIDISDFSLNFKGVQKSRAKAVTKSAAGVKYLMKENGIDVYKGTGSIKASGIVEVVDSNGSETILECKNIIVATGSVPKTLPFLDVDGSQILTSDEILTLEEPPKSLLVLGAGAIGMEFASAYKRFGSDVRVVEMLDRVLPLEDAEVSAEIEKAFKKRGISIHTSTRLENASVENGIVKAKLVNDEEALDIEAEMLLVATGRKPVSRGIGLEELGIKIDEAGFVEVNEFMQTGVDGIYAIGDIVKTPQLAHVASAEGVLAVEHMAGKEPQPINYGLTPSATYCSPEVASIGLSEEAAKEAGYDIQVGKFPFAASGKARILGQLEGFVKIIRDKKFDEVLGIHIVGPHATDLIGEGVALMNLEVTATELTHMVHPHPTLTEALHEAAHGSLHRPLHL